MSEKMKTMAVIVAMMLFFPMGTLAQNDDFGAWFSASAVKKVDQRLNIGVEAEYRLRDDLKTSDRWSVGLDASYKVFPWLKASGGYTLLRDYNQKYTYYDDPDDDYDEDENGNPIPYGYTGKVKKAAEYWGTRHRFNVSLTGQWSVGRLDLSLRERWQYTYRPEKSVTRDYYSYDIDGNVTGVNIDTDDDGNVEEKTYKGKGKSVLRSRLMLEYNIPHCKVDPFVSAEAYNAWSLYKVRYTVGADWKITKPHTLSIYYRYQNVRNNDDIDDEPNIHIVGLGYKYKF